MFSSRTPADLSQNRLARIVAALGAEGVQYFDLTVSNPTTSGFAYPAEYLDALTAPGGRTYAPHPFGLPEARTAVAREYARRHASVNPSHVVLTASTSEAYSVLFKLLCDPRDEVLVPQPSYPLFDHLLRLDACVSVPYHLRYDRRWSLDESTIDEALSSRSRAILAVSPNNPTGSFLSRGEFCALLERSRRHDLALIVDEVFADYPLDGLEPRADAVAGQEEGLVFSLGGLSKTAGLPQLKLAWIVASGPGPLVEAALARLEVICDTYLSVSTPVQYAAVDLLAAGTIVRERIQARITRNLAALRSSAAGHPSCEVLRAEGGWYAIVRVPGSPPEEALVLTLLTEDRVLVHPGYFFDFEEEGFLILSLLPEEPVFDEAVDRVLRRITS
ncbi:MAG: pyridoxal phosphate-dependent aminotransferase [Acidobacteria bacterium]|nr:pyridoxal phosphate-dependent aminotransferase [Acidobacteriota bacterium]